MNLKRIVKLSLLLFAGAMLWSLMLTYGSTCPCPAPDGSCPLSCEPPPQCECPLNPDGSCPDECQPVCDCPNPDGSCPEQCPLPLDGRMTGGGSFFEGDDKDNTRFTHGFTLRCQGEPNNLEINWNGKGKNGSDRFHLESLTAIECIDDPLLDEEHPVAGFDTITGSGLGRLNGVSGAEITFTFTDDGEPGKSADRATISITPPGGGAPTSVSGSLMNGNQQAHP